MYGHPLAGLLWERQFEKILLQARLGEGFQLGMLIRTPSKGLFISVYVDDIKFAGEKQNIDPMWKLLNKEVDLERPTSFFDHVYLGCTQRQCETSKDIVDNYSNMLESWISAGAKEKLPSTGNLTQTFPHGPMTWKVMPRNVWSDIASWRTKQPSNLQE